VHAAGVKPGRQATRATILPRWHKLMLTVRFLLPVPELAFHVRACAGEFIGARAETVLRRLRGNRIAGRASGPRWLGLARLACWCAALYSASRSSCSSLFLSVMGALRERWGGRARPRHDALYAPVCTHAHYAGYAIYQMALCND
jgi:hypothetical protein